MVPSILLVHRHEWHGHGCHGLEWSGGQCTRIQPRHVERWELSRSELAEFCGCPVDALRLSLVGPVHLAHGGAWARLEALDSLRWPFLDAPVIQGQRWRCGRCSVPVALIALARISGAAGVPPGGPWIPGRPRMPSGR